VRVWTDAHLSPALAPWIAVTFGIEAVALRDIGFREAEDAAIFAAAREAGAALMTKDSDFAELVSRHGQPPQIIWLTCGNTSNVALRAILVDAWPEVARLLVLGEPLIEIGGRAT
jgi:predicted nuclease of predicted toxin-antitoxin system